MKNKILLVSLLFVVLPCFGQAPDPTQFAAIQKQNAAALRNYEWKQRVELQVNGETKKVMLNLVRYDVNGQLQKTPLSDDSQAANPSGSSGGGGRLKQKIVEEKKQDFKDLITGLTGFVQSYAHVPPDQLKTALENAERLPPAPGMEGAVGLRLTNVLQKQDSLTAWIDKQTMLFRAIDIESQYEQKPVTVSAKYAGISGGPNAMSQAVLQYPDKNIRVQIDQFDYATQSSAGTTDTSSKSESQPTASTPPPNWPRVIEDPRGKLMIYQPQLEEWPNHTILKARSAIAFAPAGKDNPYFGIVSMQAQTEVDQESHLVTLGNLQLTASNFPGLTAEQNQKMLIELRKLVPPGRLKSMSLDEIIASLEKAGVKNVDVKNDPPKIFVSTTPSILVIIDGKPALSPIKESDLQYIVNTNWDLFYSPKEKTYYLRNDTSWLQASDLMQSWTPAVKLPDSFKKLPATDNWKDVLANIPGKPGQQAPAVLISQMPAELILLDGNPDFKPIPKTNLAWVSNTKSDLIFYPSDSYYYYLVSGRWFRTKNLQTGPWVFATSSLPPDFKKHSGGSSARRCTKFDSGNAGSRRSGDSSDDSANCKDQQKGNQVTAG